VHPVIRAIFEEMVIQRITNAKLSEMSGVSKKVIKRMRHNHLPTLQNVFALYYCLKLGLAPFRILDDGEQIAVISEHLVFHGKGQTG
jgi:hypothetical protein